jgi:hypothetical protein
MLLHVKRISSDVVAEGSEDYGFRDRALRDVGYRWEIVLHRWEVLTADEAAAEGHYTCFRLEEERFNKPYRVYGTPTRNGKAYGPTNWTNCASLDLAQKNVATRLKNARKRDTKKFVQQEFA